MTLEILLATAFGGAFVTYFLGKLSKKVRDVFAVFITLTLTGMVAFLYNTSFKETFYIGFLNVPFILRTNSLAWFFAIAISAFTALSVIFSLSYIKGKERTDLFHFLMQLINAGMLGIVFSGDFVSFYIFWEIMSWSTFLLICYNRGASLAAGRKYIIMSLIGSMSMLIGILSLYSNYGTFTISEIAPLVASASTGYQLFLLIIFSITFGIKNAVMPLHTWLPDAYTEAPSPFTAVLSGMLTRMGVYGFLLILYVIVGFTSIFQAGNGLETFNYVLAWLGAITIVIPTFIAMLQNDAKKLLAWHGIGQGGYMILGIAFGTSLGMAGGIFHTLNHAIYIVLLFMSVAAVEYRTRGERDLNSLGGLIKKMPVAFLGGLVGICGLIGVPLTNGFVSKWLIYKTLIIEGSPFLAFAALVGTWGTILSVYKFLHNMFLGQLPEKYNEIKRSPFNMQLPIILLSFTIIFFGVLPGIPLKVINNIVTSFGLESLNVSIWGIASETGALNTINIFMAIFAVGLLIWVLTRQKRKTFAVNQYDTYAAGAAIPKDKYQYSVNFYNPFYRMAAPYLKDFIDDFYMKLAQGVKDLGNGLRRIYTGDVGYYVMYIILFLALLIFVQINWQLW
ncbi:MAG: proton-conducting transporter membrane subunit [Bacteroidota bacterium]